MSAALKRNALAMQQGVANRGAILEETDEFIERNLAMQQQSVKRSKEEYRRCSSSLQCSHACHHCFLGSVQQLVAMLKLRAGGVYHVLSWLF